jgi:hypothetical protein
MHCVGFFTTEFGYQVLHKNGSVPEIQYNTYAELIPTIINTVNHPVILFNFKSTHLTFRLMGQDKCWR